MKVSSMKMWSLHSIICLSAFILLCLCNVSVKSLFLNTVRPEAVGLPRIVGGYEATVDYPFVVSLTVLGYHVCAGSIVNENTIVTAAHCLDHVPFPRLMRVHVGDRHISMIHGRMYPVDRYYRHNLWNASNLHYDVGIVRLYKPLKFNKYVQPIELVNASYTAKPGAMATVLGWGHTQEAGEASNVLRVAHVPIIKHSDCKKKLRNYDVTESMLCAGYKEGGIDACQMDSGGPLVLDNKLIGIISWGSGCAKPDKPGVYTRISKIRSWIDRVLRRNYKELLDYSPQYNGIV